MPISSPSLKREEREFPMQMPTNRDRVLVIDDDPHSLEFLSEILAGENLKVLSAGSGRSAMEAITTKAPSLILLDINMPGIDGFEICEKLKADVRYCGIPIIFVSGVHNHKEKIRGFDLGAVDFISKPYHADELIARVRTHLELNRLRTKLEAEVALRTKELFHSFKQMRKVLEAIVNAMAVIVETRDPYTAGHQRRVSQLSLSIAEEMKLDKEVIEGLQMAAAIHDIGKISIPAEILTKPSKLTDMEFNLIKDHPRAGYAILKDIEFPWPIARVVLEHHERLDGSGYPQGLKGRDMLLESRILAVADVVESMASHRPYRPGMGIDTALDEIENNRGILYDADVVDVCLRLFQEGRYSFGDPR